MTNIVVLIKQVPDTWSERKLTDGDYTLDREAADAVLDEINERAVEEALQIREKEAADGVEGSVTVLTAGPERATEAIRKALSMGADKAVHLKDDGMHGSDVVQTGWALARALGTIEGTELVIAGNEATDGVGGAVPAIIAEYLGLPQLTHLRKLSRRGRQGHRRARDRRRRVHPRGHAARGRQRQREDQRAALPVLQGHHGRQEEGSHGADPGRDRRRGRRGRAGQRRARRCSRRRRSRPRPRARRSPTRARAATRSPSTWSARRSSNGTHLLRPPPKTRRAR